MFCYVFTLCSYIIIYQSPLVFYLLRVQIIIILEVSTAVCIIYNIIYYYEYSETPPPQFFFLYRSILEMFFFCERIIKLCL